jgi:D-beta-D-heptose 7-phosphate kinase/D-beta-D-heptose 1-phosphate adenosyltransferase
MATTHAWRAALLERFPGQPVLVVGDIILDEYITGDCSRMSAEAPVAIVRVDHAWSVLGGAGNAAANMAALGGRVTLIGLCGDDESGHRLREIVADQKIDFRPVSDGRPTTKKTRVIGQHQQLLRLDHEVTRSVRPEVEAQLIALALEALPQAGIVVLSDYAKGVLTDRVCQEIIAKAHEAGREVLIDPRPEHGRFYVGCDFITPNWKEGVQLVGQHDLPLTEASVQETGRALVDRFGSNVILTLGAHGIEFFGRNGDHFAVPTVAREVYDVSGAGDTVVAALAVARSAGADHEQAVTVANAAAGVVVGKLGTATVTRAEITTALLPEARLLSRADLRRTAERLRAEGKRIVTINGSFDLMHYGHAHILQEARRLGDVLIVGLNSDRSVQTYKGPDRPIVTEAERARMLLALRSVDYVHIFDEAVPMPFLEEIQPDVHVNGSEYGADCIEAETVKRHGGRIHIVERLEGLSTSGIISRVVATQAKSEV